MPLTATCHCGATKIEAPVPTSATECNCTYCARTGAVWAYYKPGELQMLSQDGERTYSASDAGNDHHFCGRCGMQTWGDSPDWGSVYNVDGTPKPGFEAGAFPSARIHALNLRLVDDLDWSAIAVEKVDGRNNW
ncbi:MAG: aldehyde-activating protein [Phenylobacterium sp.]|uniref:GFA family protein n=1 Tax=Phenylobacterium sp. TaxID=1871053 RepID=UPI0025D25386|nr:aldehyde-activating protein [Phenylobacterium sp.]MBA4011486.1 aldehyde-activating protein [Phenylobacterium sp.]